MTHHNILVYKNKKDSFILLNKTKPQKYTQLLNSIYEETEIDIETIIYVKERNKKLETIYESIDESINESINESIIISYV